MAANHATKGLKHRLETERTIEHREDTLSKGVVEPASAVATARLRWPHQDDGGSRVDPAKQLENAVSGGPGISLGLHRHLQIDESDVNLLAGHQIRRIPAATGLQAPDAHGVEQPG